MIKIFVILIVAFSAFSLKADPPPVPSAGIIERQIEKEYEAEPLEIDKKVPEIQVDIPKEKLDLPEGVKVFICKVEIRGNKEISTRELNLLLEKEVDCECSIVDIYALCHKIEEYYFKKGFFLARAYPPPQDIKNNVLIIEVLEGRLGNVRVIGNKYYSSNFILSYFSKMQNKAIRYDKFLRALMLLNENSDLIAGSIFEKGKKVGEADVIIRVDDKRPIHLYVNANDYGRWLTTDFRVGGRLDKGSLFFYGDKLSIAEVVGFPIKALYFTDVVYSVPLNSNGSYLEGAYLTSRFHVQDLTELHLKGHSDIATLKFTHKLRRSRFLNCDIFSYFDYKQIKNFTLGNLSSFDKLRVLTFGTLLDHNSPGIGRDYLILRMAIGLPGFLNGLNKNSSGCSRPGAQGNFFKFNLDYDRLQKLGYDCFLFFHTSGQWSPNKLTTPEQMYLGGADTVRGYPLAIAVGDSGYYYNLEFRMPPWGLSEVSFFKTKKKFKDILQLSAFFDQGGVFLKSSTNNYLCGTGAGVVIKGPLSLSLTLDAGFPLIHESRSKKAFFYVKITGQPF